MPRDLQAHSSPDDGCVVGVFVGIDADHVGGDVVALGGRGDDDLLGACLQVLACTGAVNEHAGALERKDQHTGQT